MTSPSSDDPQRNNAQILAETLGRKALDGDIRAAQELGDRAEGRPRQSIELENSTLRAAFERMNREELKLYAVEGRLPAWFSRVTEGEKREQIN